MTGHIDPAATFLNVVVPWSQDTYVNVHAFLYENGRLVPKASRAARNVREAISFAKWCDAKGWEVYACMSSQRSPGVGKPDKLGRTNYRALRGEANAAQIKSFYLDVDVKEGSYASTDDAIMAVQIFCRDTGLPPPSLVVYSGGGGFHAHWVLDKPIDPETWKDLSPKLAEACRRHNLLADHNVTVDIARILRVPGTSNRKYGAPRPVTMEVLGPSVDINIIEEKLIPYPSAAGISLQGINLGPGNDSRLLQDFPSRTPVDLAEHWLAGISSPQPTLEEVAAEGACPVVRDTLKDEGKGQREPLWFAMGHVCAFTVGGLDDFHKLSRGHEGYDPEATNEKFQRILDNKLAKDQGWPRCQTIQNDGATQCASCPHLKENKSPLNFAVRVTPPGNPQGPVNGGDNKRTVTVPGYLVNQTSGVYSHPATEAKPETAVWSYPMWSLDYREDHKGRFTVQFFTQKVKEGLTHVVIPTSAMRNQDTLRGCLVDTYGLGVLSTEQKGLLDFMASFKSQLRTTLDVVARQELMGWSEDNGKPSGFIYGPTRFNCAGNTHFNQADPMIRDMYFPHGSLDPWIDAVRMINAEQRPEMDMLVATAFAAPLMKFTSEKGVVISAWSTGSSHHKTSAIKVGQGVWGSAKGINQLTDTIGSMMERIGLIRVMPSYFDEMKSSYSIKQFVQMIYQFSGGRGKGRLNRNAELKDIQTWETLLVGVSNESVVDTVARSDKTTEAGINRIFEFEVGAPDPAHGQISMGDAGVILKKLESNYGHAGLRYAEYLGQSVERLPEQVPALVDKLVKDFKAGHDERYWVSAAAVLLTGAQAANDLNLARFDVGRMKDFIERTFVTMRLNRMRSGVNVSNADNIYNILSAFVNSDRRGILATDTTGQPGRIGQQNPVTVFNYEDVRLSTELKIRYIEDVRLIRLSRRALINWLIKQEISPGSVINNIMTRYSAREIRSSLGTGTDRKGAQEKLIELDLNHPDLVGLYSKHV